MIFSGVAWGLLTGKKKKKKNTGDENADR